MAYIQIDNTQIQDGVISKEKIAAGSGIEYTKLNLGNSIKNSDIFSGAAIAYSKLNLANSIVNNDIAYGAAITYSKLSLTDSIVDSDIHSAASIDASKIAGGNVSNTEFGYLANVSSDIQAQIDALAGGGGIFTPNIVLVSDALGSITSSSISTTELGYLSGVTSNIQTQIGNKEPTVTSGTSSQYYRGDKTWQTLNTTAVVEGTNLYYTDVRADARITAQKGVANGIATLDVGGKIPSTQLPAIAITNSFVVASEVAMLALVAETGDVAVRTDINKSFILAGTDPSVLGDWQELLSPTDAVQSVNGQTGVVSLTTSDISEGTNLYFTEARAIASVLTGYTAGAGTVTATDTILQALQKLDGNIGLKANIASPSFTGTVDMSTLQASTSGGLTLKSSAGTNIGLFGAGGGTNATFYGGVNVATQLSVGDVGVTGGQLELHGSTSGSVLIDVLATAGSWTMTLPDSAGTTGQVLTTDGAGNTSWTTVSGGGSFSWGATASGTSGTGIGLTIGASASAATAMQSYTWDNTQSNATYGQVFNYGTSTTAKYGQYHNLTTNTGAIPMYVYYNNGTAFTSPGIFFQKASGSTIGGSTGAIKFAELVSINSRIGTGIYFESLTGGTASSSSTAYAIRYSDLNTTASYGYANRITNINNGTGRGYFMHADRMNNVSGGLAYGLSSDYGSYASSTTSSMIRIEQSGAYGASSVFHGIYVNALSSGSGSYGYLVRAQALVAASTSNGYGLYLDYIMGNATSGTGVGYYVGNMSLTGQNALGNFWYLNNSQTAVSSGYSRTATMADMRSTRAVSTAGVTITDTYNVSEWRRYNGANNATATMNASGSIGYFENAVYGTTTGTLNDTVNPIKIVQHSQGSGAPISITQNYVTSSSFRKLETETNTTHSRWVSNGTSPNGSLSGNAGDVCYNGDGGKIYYCTGTTNWTSAGGITPTSGALFTVNNVYNTVNPSTTTLFTSGTGSLTLPANFFTVGKTVKIKLRGWFNNTSSGASLRLSIGSTMITLSSLTFTSGYYFDIEGTVTCNTTGSSGVLFGYFSLMQHPQGGTVVISNRGFQDTFTCDTTTAKIIDVNATASSSTVYVKEATVEYLN